MGSTMFNVRDVSRSTCLLRRRRTCRLACTAIRTRRPVAEATQARRPLRRLVLRRWPCAEPRHRTTPASSHLAPLVGDTRLKTGVSSGCAMSHENDRRACPDLLTFRQPGALHRGVIARGEAKECRLNGNGHSVSCAMRSLG